MNKEEQLICDLCGNVFDVYGHDHNKRFACRACIQSSFTDKEISLGIKAVKVKPRYPGHDEVDVEWHGNTMVRTRK